MSFLGGPFRGKQQRGLTDESVRASFMGNERIKLRVAVNTAIPLRSRTRLPGDLTYNREFAALVPANIRKGIRSAVRQAGELWPVPPPIS
jgi:hypothetical protein